MQRDSSRRRFRKSNQQKNVIVWEYLHGENEIPDAPELQEGALDAAGSELVEGGQRFVGLSLRAY